MSLSNNVPATAKSLLVVVLDDDIFQIEIVSDILRSLGVSNVVTATNGKDALRAFGNTKQQPDLLLCDLHMPGMDGFQFMTSISDNGYRGAVLIVSGQDSRVLHSAALVAQLSRFDYLGTIEKPVSRATLASFISRLST